jgi:hypothetical protein
MTSELTGATVTILETIETSLQKYIGCEGVMISESQNCFHIAYASMTSGAGM